MGPVFCQAQIADLLQAVVIGTVHAGVQSQALGSNCTSDNYYALGTLFNFSVLQFLLCKRIVPTS